MMSRTQWYVFSGVRLSAFAVLVWSVGNWIDRLPFSNIGKNIIEFLSLTVSIATLNSWIMRYDTYVAHEEELARRKGAENR